jgi:hypothetical protein
MAKLEDILNEWKIDSKIAMNTLENDLFNTPNIHAKYLEYYVQFKGKLSDAERKYNTMQWIKRKYFRGECEEHELQQYGWSQWQGIKPTYQELNFLLESDRDMNDLKIKVDYYKTAVSSLEYIMKSIGSRDYSMKTIVDYQKYLGGN